MTRLVALDIPPSPTLTEAIRDAFEKGDAVTVVDTAAPKARQLVRLKAARPHVIRTLEGDAAFDPHAPLLESDDRVVITTSGTTGPPQAVIHKLANLQASATAIARRLDTKEDDHWLCALSPAYIGGLAIITRSILGGLGLTVVPRFGRDEVTSALDAGATRTAAVTAVLSRLDLSPFRTVLLGAGPPPDKLPSNAIVTYGLTETGSGVVYDGAPLDTVECRLISNEIMLRGPMIARRNRAGSALLDAEGWLHTGDYGSLKPDGRLVVHGRMGEMVNTGGQLVNPAVVEDAILGTFACEITDVCVIGVPDPVWHEVVTAAVVSSRTITAQELKERLADQLARFELPRKVVAITEVPRTETGKPRRRFLARQLGNYHQVPVEQPDPLGRNSTT